MKEGWICPICGKVLSPYIETCINCSATNDLTENFKNVSPNDCIADNYSNVPNKTLYDLILQVQTYGRVVNPMKE